MRCPPLSSDVFFLSERCHVGGLELVGPLEVGIRLFALLAESPPAVAPDSVIVKGATTGGIAGHGEASASSLVGEQEGTDSGLAVQRAGSGGIVHLNDL